MSIITMDETLPADHGAVNPSDECKELLLSLPKVRGNWGSLTQYLYQGFWCPTPQTLQAILAFQTHFQAKNSDIVVASLPKCGTTWLKALTFAVLNRRRFGTETPHPLLTSNSHKLVPFFEFYLYIKNQVPDFSPEFFPEPRLFGSHLPYHALGTIKESDSKVIYVCRNPFDSFISHWHFINKVKNQSLGQWPLDDAFDKYCQGMNGFGPFWDHILGYWKQSLEKPNKVLFLRYEELHKDVASHLKTLAVFLDLPFSEEEERDGVIEDIVKLCSFDTMKELDINKTGKFALEIEHKHLFRKAEVGDWVNYFTPEMKERMSKIIEEKFHDSGLTFEGINPKLTDHVEQN